MKQRSVIGVISLLVVASIAGSIAAQDAVRVSFSETWWDGATQKLDYGPQTISFTTVIATHPVKGGTNGFRIYVLEGGDFGPVTGSFPAHPGWDGGTFVNLFSCDGTGADTIGFGGFAIGGSGLPVGTNVFYTATTDLPTALSGKHLCIDTAFYPLGGAWLWSTDYGDVVPDWYDQPYCLMIQRPCKSAAQIENCPSSTLTLDHCNLVTYDFNTPDEASNPPGYWITGGLGSIDPVTGVWSYQPTLADVGQVRTVTVGTNDWCASACSFHVEFTNQAPTIACQPPHLVHDNMPNTMTVAMSDSDDCDSGSYSILSAVPAPVGAYFIDPATGLFTFTPATADGNLDFIFTVQYTDGLATATCDQQVAVVRCCYVRGDASGDLEGPNISDITSFVGWLFGTLPVFPCTWALDVNNDNLSNIADLTYLVDFLFRGGPAPVPCP